MKRVIVVIMIMITVLAVSAQDTVRLVIPSYAKPYFLGNVRVKDSLETKLMLVDSAAISNNVAKLGTPEEYPTH